MGALGISKEVLGLPQFLVAPEEFVQTGDLIVSGQEARHMAGSRRLRPGDRVRLADGSGRVAVAQIEAIEKAGVRLSVVQDLGARDDLIACTIYLSLIRLERFEFALSKLFEIGVAAVQPIVTTRSLSGGVRPERVLKRLPRWERMALEALKQSRGFRATEVRPPVPLGEAVLQEGFAFKLALLEERRGSGFLQVLEGEQAPFPCCVAIGPEGGFDPSEKEVLLGSGFQGVGLGNRILRSETAAIYAAAAVAEVYLKKGQNP
ncbi:MAG: 16S rRNA (uracil(1498)-N(3))-methyltransferase [Thermodesulfobacteria bacterium]|nr:16S rRNA (uracil(1498)-N(3))-methyltransferase [Thermodesulfobacteriota bacterium]